MNTHQHTTHAPPAYRSRKALEAAIQAALDALDRFDGDPDLEMEEAEPSLGAPAAVHGGSQISWSAGGCDDFEMGIA